VRIRLTARSAEEFACHDASCRPPKSGGTGGSKKADTTTTKRAPAKSKVSEIQFPNGANPNLVARQKIIASSLDTSKPGDSLYRIMEAHAHHVKDAIGPDPEVRVRVPVRVLEQVLADGEVKTQHETGDSGGMLDPEVRADQERNMFAAEGTRPVYGYVMSKPGASYGSQSAYGDVALVLKRDVVDRTTMTVGDSLFRGDRSPAPIPLREVSSASPARITVATTENRPGMGGRWSRELPSYFEAQIHGGVKLSDIDHLEISTGYESQIIQLAKLANAHGLKLITTNVHRRDYEVEGVVSFHRHDGEDFACHDASCRPPTSGGTGGSRPAGATSAPAGKKPREIKVSGDYGVKFKETAFTHKVNAAIAAEPALAGLMTPAEHRAKVEAARAADDKQAREARVEKLTHGDVAISTWGGSYTGGSATGSMSLRRDIRDRIDRGDLKRFVEDPNIVPHDEIDGALKELVARGLAGDPYQHLTYHANVVDPLDPTTHINVDITVRSGYSKNDKILIIDPVTLTEEFEAASTRVGRVIHDEIASREANLFDESRFRTNHATVVNRLAEVLDTDPGNVQFQVFDSGVSVGLRAGHPVTGHVIPQDVRQHAIDIIKKTGVKSSDVALEVLNRGILAHRQAFKDVMSEVRPMGGVLAGTPADRKQKGVSSHTQALEAATHYPEEWVGASSFRGPINFKQTKGRAHYQNSTSEITLDGTTSTAVHEVGHRMEHVVPGLMSLEAAFFDRRTVGNAEVRLNRAVPGSGYKSHEKTKEDQFFNPYAGKRYPGGEHELFTMGMEAVARGVQYNASGGFASPSIRKIDPDYSSWVLGALAVLYRGG